LLNHPFSEHKKIAKVWDTGSILPDINNVFTSNYMLMQLLEVKKLM